jgi:PAS domain-containing protein
VQDSAGKLLRLVGTSIDIEGQKRAEQAQRESEQGFRLIVAGIAGLVATMTADGEVELVNRQPLEFLGKRNVLAVELVQPGVAEHLEGVRLGSAAAGIAARRVGDHRRSRGPARGH